MFAGEAVGGAGFAGRVPMDVVRELFSGANKEFVDLEVCIVPLLGAGPLELNDCKLIVLDTEVCRSAAGGDL